MNVHVECARSGADETPIVSSSTAAPLSGLARPSAEQPAPSDCAPQAPSREICYESAAERAEHPAPSGQGAEPPLRQGSLMAASAPASSTATACTAAEALTAAACVGVGDSKQQVSPADEPPPEQMHGCAPAAGITDEGAGDSDNCGHHLHHSTPPVPPTPPSPSEGCTAMPATQEVEHKQQLQPPQSGLPASTAIQHRTAAAAAGVSSSPNGAFSTALAPSLLALAPSASTAEANAVPPCTATGANAVHTGCDVCTGAAASATAAAASSLKSLTPELLLRVMQAAAHLTAAERRASAAAARAAGHTLLALQAETGDVAPGFTTPPPALVIAGSRPSSAGDTAPSTAGIAAPAPLRPHCMGVAGVSRELRSAVQQLLSHPKDAAAVLHARDGPAACAAAVIGWPELRHSLLGKVPRAPTQPLAPAPTSEPSPSSACSSGDRPDLPPMPSSPSSSSQQQAEGSTQAVGAEEGAPGGHGASRSHLPLGGAHSSQLHTGVPVADRPPLPHPLQLRSSAPPAIAQTADTAAEPQQLPGATAAFGPDTNVSSGGCAPAGNRRGRRAAMRSSGSSPEVAVWADAAADKLLALATELAALQGVPVWTQVAGLTLAIKEHRIDCLQRAAQQRKRQQASSQQGDQAGRQRQEQPDPEADAMLALSRRLASRPLATPQSSFVTSRSSSSDRDYNKSASDMSWPSYTAHLIGAASAGNVQLLQALLGPPLPRLVTELPVPPRTGPRAEAQAAAAAGLRRPQGPTAALLRPRRPLSVRPWLPVALHVLVPALRHAAMMQRLEAAALLVLQYGAPADIREDGAGGRLAAPVAMLGRLLAAEGVGHEGGVIPALTWRRLEACVESNDPGWTELCLVADVWRRRKFPLPAVPRQGLLDDHWPGCAAAAADVVAAAAAPGASEAAEAVAEALAEEEALHGRGQAAAMLRRVAASANPNSGPTARVLLRYLWPNLQRVELLGAALAAATHTSAVSALAEVTPRGALHSLASKSLVAVGGDAQRAFALVRVRLLLQVLLRDEDGGVSDEGANALAVAPLPGLRPRRRLLDTLPRELADLLGAAVAGAAQDGRAEAVRVLLLQEQEGQPPPPLSQECFGRVLEAAADSPPGPAAVEVVRLVLRAAANAAPAESRQQQVVELLITALPAIAERRRVDVATALITAAATHLYTPEMRDQMQHQELQPPAATGAGPAHGTAGAATPEGASTSRGTAQAAGALTWAARAVVAPAVLRTLQASSADALATIIAATVAAAAEGAVPTEAPVGSVEQSSSGGAGDAGLWQRYGLLAAALSELDAAPGPSWRLAAGDVALALLASPPPQPLSSAVSYAAPGSAMSERLARRLAASSAAFVAAAGGRRPAVACACWSAARHLLYQCPHCCWYTSDGVQVVAGAEAAADPQVCGMAAAGVARQAQAEAEERVRARAVAIHALLAVGRARPVRWQPLQASSSGGGSAGLEQVPAGSCPPEREYVSQRVLDRVLLQVSLQAVAGCSGCDGDHYDRDELAHARAAGMCMQCYGCQHRRRHHSQPPLSTESARALLSVLAGGRLPASAQGAGTEAGGSAVGVGLLAGGLRPSPAALVAAVELVCSETARLVAGYCEAAKRTAATEEGQVSVVLAPRHMVANAEAAWPAAAVDIAAARGPSSRPAGTSGANDPPSPLPHPLPSALRANVLAACVLQRQSRLAAVLASLLAPPHALSTPPRGPSATPLPAPTTASGQASSPRMAPHPQQQVQPWLASCCYPLHTGALDEAAVAAVAAGGVEELETVLAAAPLSPGGLCQVLRAVGQLADRGTAAAAHKVAGAVLETAMPAAAALAVVRRRYAVPQAVLDWLLGEAADAAAAAGKAVEAAPAGPGGGVQNEDAMGAVWLWRRAGANPWPWLLARTERMQQQQEAHHQKQRVQAHTRTARAAVAARLAVDGVLRPLVRPRAQVLWAGGRVSQLARDWVAAVREAGAVVEAWREGQGGWM